MRVSFNMGQQSSLANVARVNGNAVADRALSMGTTKKERRDIAEISPMGKANSMIEMLMKQKQRIMDSKSELTNNTLSSGGTLESIKAQLEAYEEQLKGIDEQITQTMTEQMTQKTEKTGKTDKNDIQQPKTQEEAEATRMTATVNLASNLQQAQTFSNVKKRIDQEIKVLKSEASLDSARGGGSSARTDRIATLEKRSKDINGQMWSMTHNINKSVGEIASDKRPIKSEEGEEAKGSGQGTTGDTTAKNSTPEAMTANAE